jgi:hypothetical protein
MTTWRLNRSRDSAGNSYINIALNGVQVGTNVAITHEDNITRVFRVLAVGSSIKVYWNGVLKIDITNSGNLTLTNCGLLIYRSATYADVILDNFKVE